MMTDGRKQNDPIRLPFFPFEVRNLENNLTTRILQKYVHITLKDITSYNFAGFLGNKNKRCV